MKKLIFLIGLLALIGCSTAEASQEEIWIVETPNDTVMEVHYFTGSSDTLDDVMKELKVWHLPKHQIAPSELPAREDRNFWHWNNNKLKVNQSKKTQWENDQQQKKTKYEQLCNKMGLTKVECKEFKDLQKEVGDDA